MKRFEVLLLPLIAITSSFLIGALLILFLGENPITVYAVFLEKSVFSLDGIGFTLFYATPLIFTGLAVAFGFRCGLFNIGGEGQLYVGAMAVTILAVSLGEMNAFLMVPLCFIAAMVSGGIWGGIPGFLKARFGGHEVINTIMMNFIAYSLVNYLVLGPFHRPNTQLLVTADIPESAKIARLSEFFPFLPETVPLNMGFIVALVACLVVYIILWKTPFGYEIRAVGASNSSSFYAGINVKKQTVLALAISGALAGLVGVHEIMGYRYHYSDSFSNNAGFIGIAVALLGRNHPLGVLLGALLFGALARGGLFLDIMFDKLSRDLVVVMQGVIVLCVATDQLFRRILPFMMKKNTE